MSWVKWLKSRQVLARLEARNASCRMRRSHLDCYCAPQSGLYRRSNWQSLKFIKDEYGLDFGTRCINNDSFLTAVLSIFPLQKVSLNLRVSLSKDTTQVSNGRGGKPTTGCCDLWEGNIRRSSYCTVYTVQRLQSDWRKSWESFSNEINTAIHDRHECSSSAMRQSLMSGFRIQESRVRTQDLVSTIDCLIRPVSQWTIKLLMNQSDLQRAINTVP